MRPHFARPVARRAARYAAEALEPRRLLALSVIGQEFAVNQTVTGNQDLPAVAADADGDFVVAWRAQGGTDGSADGVFARRYSAGGAALGDEFRVNTYTPGNQNDPAVAMDADGDFVVVWTSEAQDGSNTGIYGQRFDAAGSPRGNEFRVNQTTAGFQSFPAVATDADGDFVVTWASNPQDGSYDGVYARRFSAAGAPAGDEFQVNLRTASSQTHPATAMDADGDFVIAWQSYGQEDPVSGFHYGVYARRFDSRGVPRPAPDGVPLGDGDEFRVNTTTDANQTQVSVAMDAGGDFVVAWASNAAVGGEYGGFDAGVFAQRFTADGALAGGEFRANTFTANRQNMPDVSADADGDFLIAWTTYAEQDGSITGVYAKRYTAAGAELPPPTGATPGAGNEFRVNTFTPISQNAPSVALDAEGDAVIAWQSFAQDEQGAHGVYAQRYEESADAAGPFVYGLLVGGNEVAPAGERMSHAASSLTVLFSENMFAAGGATGANSVTNRANYRLARDGADVSSLVSAAAFSFNPATRRYEAALTLSAPLPDGAYVLTAGANLRDLAGNLLDGDLDGLPGGPAEGAAVPFSVRGVVPTGPEFRPTGTTAGDQARPAVASDAAGNFVVVWENLGSGNGPVFARRFDAAGQPLGGEFLASTITSGPQTRPAVAMAPDGRFVIAWEGPLPGGLPHNIFARRFSAAGEGEPGIFVITGGDDLRMPSIAMADDGSFVVAWDDFRFNEGDVYAQRYGTAGFTPLGDPFRVNLQTATGPQTDPSVAMAANGDFVVAWTSGGGQDGSGTGVFARRFSAAGVTSGGDLPVNSSVAGDQFQPAAAMDDEGDFVVAWSGAGGGDDVGVFAQRFNPAGTPQGGQIPVNVTTADRQAAPAVAADADGDFVVTWQSAGGQDGSFYGVYARRYSAAGEPQVGEFRVNSYTPSEQKSPAAAMDADGDFVLAWQSLGQDGSGQGVYAQRYGPNLPPTTVGIPPVTAQQDEADTPVDLWQAFNDPNTADDTLAFTVAGNTNPALFSSTAVDNATGTLTLDYAPGRSGQSTITVRATDPGGLFVETSFAVTVTPGADTSGPRVTAVYVDSSAWNAAFRQYLQTVALGSAALGFLAGVGADQLDELPWTNVNRFHVTFSEAVDVDAADLSVRGVNVASYALNGGAFTYDPATFTASWTLAAAVSNDRLVLDVDAGTGGVADPSGNPLDGEWADGADAFPSGDGAAGGDFRFRLNILPGDVNRNGGIVNSLDVQAVRIRQFTSPASPGTPPNTYTAFHNVDGSGGVINSIDLQLVRVRQFSGLPAAMPSFAFPDDEEEEPRD